MSPDGPGWTSTKVLVGVLAVAFFFGPALAGVAGVREKPIENRPLASAPRLSDRWAAIDDLTPWATDHLPGRSDAVHLKALIDYHGFGDLPGTSVAQPVGAAGAGTGAAAGAGRLAPPVIRGRDGYLFLGRDFTVACERAGAFAEALDDLVDVARIIERSGRRVVVAVAPNKSSIVTGALPRAVPRGGCARDGLHVQQRALEEFSDPLFIALRPGLRAIQDRSGDAYWRTDTHWTSHGASVFVRGVAQALAPDLVERIRVRPGSEEMVGDLTAMIGLSFTESPRSERVETGANVHLTSKRRGDGDKSLQTTWTASPTVGLVTGKTLLLGDSFLLRILDNLVPLFAQGELDRIGSTPTDYIVDDIAEADTVVIEVVERNLVRSPITTAKFRRDVAERLGVTDE